MLRLRDWRDLTTECNVCSWIGPHIRKELPSKTVGRWPGEIWVSLYKSRSLFEVSRWVRGRIPPTWHHTSMSESFFVTNYWCPPTCKYHISHEVCCQHHLSSCSSHAPRRQLRFSLLPSQPVSQQLLLTLPSRVAPLSRCCSSLPLWSKPRHLWGGLQSHLFLSPASHISQAG